MKKTAKRSISVLLVTLIAVCCFALIACAGGSHDEPPIVTDGPELGTYSYETDSEAYTLVLSSGKRFSFDYRGANYVGSYTDENGTFGFAFDGGSKDVMSAVLDDGKTVLTVTYNDSQMRFFKNIPYTVGFDVGGGSAVESLTVINGKTARKPADPVRDGYIFVGWYNDAEFSEPFMFGTQIVTANVTVYARWVEKVPGQADRVIDFDLNYDGAEHIASMQTTAGKLLYNVPVPSRDGYTFRGWWVSSCENPERLSYIMTEDTLFSEDTTVYALWEDANLTRLPAPIVHVASQTVSWAGIDGASTYSLEIVNPTGVTVVTETALGTTTYDKFDFDEKDAGEYLIKVVAKSTVPGNDSQAAVRCYHNKTLGRSTLSVIEPSTLLFTEVEHAEKYYVTVECGDKNHNHTMLDNGTSTNFGFANCPMTDNGIRFTVTAWASGYASSVSRTFTYKRSLSAVTGLAVDDDTQMLTWNAVENATNYIVSVKCGDPDHDHEYIDNGNKTSYCIKECEAKDGGIEINVFPKTKGFISPAPAKVTYNKKAVATPRNIRVIGEEVRWDPVANAESYSLRIGNVQKTTGGGATSFNLNNLLENWVPEGDYKLNIRANGAVNSLWSDDVDMRYYALYGSIRYDSNTVSWRHVIGAEKYEVKVNYADPVEVTDGKNFLANVKLTQAGENTISVRYFEQDTPSEWVTVKVHAYTVTFDTRKGTGADPLYVAVGDKIEYPETRLNGYEPDGWYTTPSGGASNGAIFDDTVFTGNGDLVLYAYWLPASYTVHYNYNGGNGIDQTGKVTYTKDYKLEVPTVNDGTLAFAGWYSEPTGGTQYTDEFGVSKEPWKLTRGTTMYAHWVSTLKYTLLADNTYSVAKGSGIASVTNVVIPARYNGKSVSTIAAYAFQSCSKLVSLTIPDTVNIIATTSAFSSCTLLEEINVYHVDGNSKAAYTSVDGVLIYRNTLEGRNELAYFPTAKTGEYVLSNDITAIPVKAFASAKLTSVVIPTSVTAIDSNAFYNCKQLINVTFVQGGTSPLTFGAKAFTGCSALTSVTIPARAKEFAIDNTNGVFVGCSNLVNINVEKGNQYYTSIDGVLCDASKSEIIFCPYARPGAYVVPAGINTVGASAFRACTKLTSVTISPYVTLVGDHAFYGCTSVTVVTFRGGARADCEIGKYAFNGCTKLSNVVFESGSRVVSLGSYAFSACKELVNITIPASMKKVGSYAFSSCGNLTSVEFAENGEEITFETAVFSSCTELAEVYFPATVKVIDLSMFNGCSKLSRVRIAADNPYYTEKDGIVYDKNVTTVIMCPSGKGGNITLPDTVTKIGENAFKGNAKITGITIGKNITEIGDAAFAECSALNSIIFESGGTADLTINPGAIGETKSEISDSKATFYKCNALVNVILPARLVAFAGFNNCANLESVWFERGSRLESIGQRAFAFCKKLTRFDCPSTVKTIYNKAFNYCDAFPYIDLPEGLETIGGWAFSGCKELNNITLPNTLKTLGESAFSLNGKLERIVIPASVERIESYLFSACEELREVTILCPITEILEYTFNGCKSLRAITIPNTVEFIGNKAFYECWSLVTVTFEDGGEKELVIADGTSTSNSPFASCKVLEELALPSRTVAIGNYAFANCSAITSVTFGDSSRLKKIGKYAFSGCSALTAITIPNTVANEDIVDEKTEQVIGVGDYAFSGASVLASVVFETGGTAPLTIGSAAFANCSRLESIALPARLVTAQGKNGVLKDIVPTSVFDGCSVLASVTAEDGGSLFATEDNLIYNADKTTLLYVPLGYKGKPVAGGGFDGTVTIANTVTEVVNAAFKGNSNITAVIFASGGEEELILGNKSTKDTGVFADSAVESVTLPERLHAIAPYTFYQSKSLSRIVIPKSVGIIGQYAFQNCSNLQNVSFESNGSDGLTIDDNAFNGCSSLISVYLPSRLTTIGASAFLGCAELKFFAPEEDATVEERESVDIAAPYVLPENLVSIGASAFSGCKALTEVAISSKVTAIGNNAFNGCESLQRVVLPAALETFIAAAFTKCDNLEAVITVDSKNYVSKDGVLFSADGSTLIYFPVNKGASADNYSYKIPDGVLVIGDNAFAGQKNITSVTVPNSVQCLEKGAFFGCKKLVNVIFEGGNDNTDLVIDDANSSSKDGAFAQTAISEIAFPSRLVALGSYAFYKANDIANVTFGAGSRLQTIGQYALGYDNSSSKSKLKSIALPNTVTIIGKYAFSKTGLESIEVPASVTEIGNYAFQSCTDLVTVTFADNCELKTIYDYAFKDCGKLTNVNLENCYVLETLGASSFNGCAFSSIELPVALSSIGNQAFYSCANLDSVTIPSNVQTIGSAAFAKTSIAEVVFEGGDKPLTVTDGKSVWTATSTSTTLGAFAGLDIQSIILPKRLQSVAAYMFDGCSKLNSVAFEGNSQVKSIEKYAFNNCMLLASIGLPNSLEKIADYAFAASGLTEIALPDKVTSLGNYVFQGCTQLADVSFPDALISMGTNVFANCTSLTSVILPQNLTEIKKEAFKGCTSLQSVTIPASVTSIENAAFDGCAKLATITFEDGDVPLMLATGTSTAGVFRNCTSLETIDFPKRLSAIGDYAFNGCNMLNTVTFADGATVAEIGDYAFKGCSNFQEIEIPASLIRIGKNAFENCTALSSLTFIDGKLSIIDVAAFNNCINLEKVVIPASVVSVGAKAFYNCRGLVEILLTGGGSLGNEAFYGCVNVAEVNISGNITKLGDNVFYGIPKLTVAPDNVDYVIENGILYTSDKSVLVMNLDRTLATVTIPASVQEIANNAFIKNTRLVSVVFENDSSLVAIGANAFERCTKLGEIVLPDTLERLGEAAFKDCVSLESAIFENSDAERIVKAGKSAFENCVMLKTAVLPEGLTTIEEKMFYGTLVEEVEIPASVTSVAKNAFAGCVNLTSVSILGNSKLDATSFAGCIALENLALAEGMTAVANNAFKGYVNLRSITIPSTVKTIGTSAFDGCVSLQEVKFADGSVLTEIGGSAFKGCIVLNDITIPAGVTKLGANVFQNCTALQSVNFAGNSVENIGNNAFDGCSALATIELPSSVSTIGTFIFQNCTSLSSVTMNDGIAKIPSSAFKNCASLTAVEIPSSVTAIDGSAFEGSGITSISVPQKVKTLGTSAFKNCAALAGITFEGNGIAKFDSNTFEGCTALTDIIIPDGVATLGSSVFKGSGLTSIVIPEKVTALLSYAFANCENLQTVEFEGTTVNSSTASGASNKNKIAMYAFQNCSSLVSVKLPPDITAIDSGAFEGCTNLVLEIPTKVNAITASGTSSRPFGGIKGISVASASTAYKTEDIKNASDKVIGSALYNKSGTKLLAVAGGPFETFEVPASVTEIDKGAFFNISVNKLVFASGSKIATLNQYAFDGSGIKTIDIPASVTKIDNYAFRNSALESIVIPETVTTCGTYIFQNCKSLGSAEFKKIPTDKTLQNYMFNGCVALSTVTLPVEAGKGFVTIGSYAFENCTNLTSINLGNDVQTISIGAFKNSGLTSMTLPSELTTIGSSVFENCAIAQITFPEKLSTIDSKAFAGSSLVDVVIPATVDYMFASVFSGCEKLHSVTFMGTTIASAKSAASANKLASKMFENCKELSSVTLPSKLLTIDSSAFIGCRNLLTIALPQTLTAINDSAFEDAGLTSLTIPESVASIGSKAFKGNEFGSVTLPTATASVGTYAFQNCANLTSVEFKTATLNAGTTVNTLASYIFDGCGSLATVTLPDSIATIGTSAFRGCESLETIALPSALTAINDSAFIGSGLTGIVIPEKVGTIGANAFENCASLASVEFAENAALASVGNSAFAGSGLTGIVIPEKVTSLGTNAFENCASLVSVEFIGNGITVFNASLFKSSGLQTIIVPKSVMTFGSGVFENCASLASVTFADGCLLSVVGGRSFAGCTSLASIVLPESITQLTAAGVFDGWTAAQTVYMTVDEGAADEWHLQWESGSGANVVWSYGAEQEI